MFSIFFDVLDLLNSYEEKRFESVEVSFDREGHYYDSQKGPDWWNYYFEPINLGPQNSKKKIYGCTSYVNPYNIEFHTSRSQAHSLIKTYIRIKPDILHEIDRFEADEFKGHYVIVCITVEQTNGVKLLRYCIIGSPICSTLKFGSINIRMCAFSSLPTSKDS